MHIWLDSGSRPSRHMCLPGQILSSSSLLLASLTFRSFARYQRLVVALDLALRPRLMAALIRPSYAAALPAVSLLSLEPHKILRAKVA